MRPMLVPQVVRVDSSNYEAGNGHIDGQLAPEITGGCSVIPHSLSLPVESIVVSSLEGTALSTRESSLEGLSDDRSTQLHRGACKSSLREHVEIVPSMGDES